MTNDGLDHQAPADDAWTRDYEVRWSEVDAVGHLANSGFLDLCADARFAYFSAHGLPPAEFARHGLGPVVFEDRISYRREVRLLETVTVTLQLGGAKPDGSRWRLVQFVVRSDGEVAAALHTDGGWLDMAERRLATPPQRLAVALLSIPHTRHFATL